MKIQSTFTIDDCIFAAEHISKNRQSKQGFLTTFYGYYIAINIFAVPAILLFFSFYLTGLAVFLLGLVVFAFLPEKLKKQQFREYYQAHYQNEDMEIEVELIETGVLCSAPSGAEAFFPWSKFEGIVETGEMIFLFTKTDGIPVAKHAFDSLDQQDQFINFVETSLESSHLLPSATIKNND